jgi:outer membrane immunogenic protein
LADSTEANYIVKRILNASVAAVGLATSGAAFAADMAVKAPPPPPVDSSWAGPYIGGHLGVAIERNKFTDIDNFGFFLPGGLNDVFLDNTKAGFIGGGQVGYNWQVNRFVFGVEGDLSWINARTNVTINAIPTVASAKMDWMTTFRGRVGMAVSPMTLLYLTGGVAIARFSDAWGDLAAAPQGGYITSSHTRAGPVVGGGVEYKATPNWIVRVEGLYADFGSKTDASVFASQSYRTSFAHSVAVVRTGLSFKW